MENQQQIPNNQIWLKGFVSKHEEVVYQGNKIAERFRLGFIVGKDEQTDEWKNEWITVNIGSQAIQNGVTATDGAQVLISGKVRCQPWNSGEKRGINTFIQANAIKTLRPPQQQQQQQQWQPAQQSYQQQQPQPQPQPPPAQPQQQYQQQSAQNFNPEDDNIPF